jgi:hypothetical protein
MADGTIPIRWSAPLPVVEEVAVAAEPLVERAQAEPLERQRVRPLQVQRPAGLAVAPEVAVEVAAEAEAVQQPRPHHRRIFSAPSRICFTSPI